MPNIEKDDTNTNRQTLSIVGHKPIYVSPKNISGITDNLVTISNKGRIDFISIGDIEKALPFADCIPQRLEGFSTTVANYQMPRQK
jgi:hypothetical protein